MYSTHRHMIVLYVIILSAALDLVSADTPKGVVALFNIFPALITKVVWPLLSNGKIRYTRRVGFCTICSWFGIIVSLPLPFLFFSTFFVIWLEGFNGSVADTPNKDNRIILISISTSPRDIPSLIILRYGRTHLPTTHDHPPY